VEPKSPEETRTVFSESGTSVEISATVTAEGTLSADLIVVKTISELVSVVRDNCDGFVVAIAYLPWWVLIPIIFFLILIYASSRQTGQIESTAFTKGYNIEHCETLSFGGITHKDCLRVTRPSASSTEPRSK
jgi:hypothetical protein